MRNYHIVAGVKRWALQDSNLRPSDYESVSRPSENSAQRTFPSAPARQSATNLASDRQESATPSATHFSSWFA